MRTTLAIDDDVLRAARKLARSERKTLGEKLSELARQSLQPAPGRRTRNGVPLLPVRRGGARMTSQLVRQLGEELP